MATQVKISNVNAGAPETLTLKPASHDHVEVLQITDLHIFDDADECMDGVNPCDSLQAVLALARERDWPVDAVLATGDLVHWPTLTAYQRLSAILSGIDRPVACLPGNHDAPSLMRRTLNRENLSTPKVVEVGAWLIIMLDSFVPGDTHAGALSEDELTLLDRSLRERPDRHALICLHHPPVEIGSPWMDQMRLQNPQAFFDVIDGCENARAVLCGHVHQEFSAERNGVRLLAAPSTCVQFVPGADRYQKDHRGAGYRHLKLHACGAINTRIRRLW